MTIENGRIFFLGAGFSAGAGVPLTQDLLSSATTLFKDECNGVFQRVQSYAVDCDVDLEGVTDATDFSRLCTHLEFIELQEFAGGERWSDDGSREKLCLKFYLSKSIALSTPDPKDIPSYYLEFVSGLREGDIVVTFNWDVLLEKCLQSIGKRFSYNFAPDCLHISKPHGSISWIFGQPKTIVPTKNNFEYAPLKINGPMMPADIYHSNKLYYAQNWTIPEPLVDEVRPLIVLPGFGKGYDVRVLASYWYRTEFIGLRKGGVSIIGLSVSEDDFIVESLFRHLFMRSAIGGLNTKILNPNPDVHSRFRNMSGRSDMCHLECYFDENSVNSALHQ